MSSLRKDDSKWREILEARAVDLCQRIGVREDYSDIVQQTLLQAQQAKFRGTTEQEYLHFLCKIQNNVFTDKLRQHHADKRDIAREQRQMDESTEYYERQFVAEHTSPSAFRRGQPLYARH